VSQRTEAFYDIQLNIKSNQNSMYTDAHILSVLFYANSSPYFNWLICHLLLVYHGYSAEAYDQKYHKITAVWHSTFHAAVNSNSKIHFKKLVPWGTDGRLPLSGDFW